MIFLYNKERIVAEGFELVKLKIAQRLGLGPNVVEGNFIIKEGKLIPDFQIDENKVPDEHKDLLNRIVSEEYKDQLDNIIHEEWQKGVILINDRLANLGK